MACAISRWAIQMAGHGQRARRAQIGFAGGAGLAVDFACYGHLRGVHIIMLQFFCQQLTFQSHDVSPHLALEGLEVWHPVTPDLTMLVQELVQTLHGCTFQNTAFVANFHWGSLLVQVGFLG